MQRACSFRRLDGVAGGAVVERRQDDDVALGFDDLQRAGHRQRVHADRHVLAVIFQHAERQHDGPVRRDGGAYLMRQHHFVAHQRIRLPLAGSNRCTQIGRRRKFQQRRRAASRSARGTRRRCAGADRGEHLRFRARRLDHATRASSGAAEREMLGPHAEHARTPAALHRRRAQRQRRPSSRDERGPSVVSSLPGKQIHRRRADEAGDEQGRRAGRRAPAAGPSARSRRRASRRCGRPWSSPRPDRA